MERTCQGGERTCVGRREETSAGGIIYGNYYERYKVEDIKKIKDYEFLKYMHMNRFCPAQPPTDEDNEDMCTVLNAVKNRMDELSKLNELELLSLEDRK